MLFRDQILGIAHRNPDVAPVVRDKILKDIAYYEGATEAVYYLTRLLSAGIPMEKAVNDTLSLCEARCTMIEL